MSDEATIQGSLQIVSGELQYYSRPTVFLADVAGAKGPVPGAISVSTAGTDVDFSELTTPGLCRIMNVDPTNFFEYGIWDPESHTFYPLGELLVGEFTILRLSRNIQEEYGTAPGTGTTGADTNRLRLKANVATCIALVEAFEV